MLTIPESEKIYGAKDGYDYVHGCSSCYQTVVTATVANPHRVDGLAVEVQQPNYHQEELAYLEMTQQDSYDQMEQVRERLIELLHYRQHQLSYRKRTEMAVDIVKQIEAIDAEIAQTPDAERRQRLSVLASLATTRAIVTKQVESRALELAGLGFKAYDALHIVCAEAGNADILLTTDDRLIRKAAMHNSMLQVRVQNPILWLLEVTTNGNA